MRRRSDFEHLAPIGSQGASQDVLGWSRMLPRLPNMHKMDPRWPHSCKHRPTQLLTIAPRWHYDGPRRANMAQRWPTWARGGQRWLQDIAPNYFSHDLNGFKTYARWFQIASCLPNMAQDDTTSNSRIMAVDREFLYREFDEISLTSRVRLWQAMSLRAQGPP